MFGRRKKAKAAAAAAAAAANSSPSSTEGSDSTMSSSSNHHHINHKARTETRSPDKRPSSFAQGLVRRSSNPTSLSLSGSTSSVSMGSHVQGSGASDGSPESSYGSLNGATAWKASQRQSKVKGASWLPPTLTDPSMISVSSTTTDASASSTSTQATGKNNQPPQYPTREHEENHDGLRLSFKPPPRGGALMKARRVKTATQDLPKKNSTPQNLA